MTPHRHTPTENQCQQCITYYRRDFDQTLKVGFQDVQKNLGSVLVLIDFGEEL